MTLAVAQNWFKQGNDLVDGGRPRFARQEFKHATAESLEPCGHPGSQRRGARRQGDFIHQETLGLQPRAILRTAEKAVVFDPLRRNSEGSQDRQQRHANRGDVSLAAAFGHQAAARLQLTMDTPKDGIVIAHPVQRSIGKDGVEFAIEGKCFPTHMAGV
jgi:hypothetical protein